MDSASQAWISPLPSLDSSINWGSPEAGFGGEERNSFSSGSLHSPESTQSTFEFPHEDRKEARYLMHYVRNLASWIDICDPNRSFGTEVPQRARKFPLMSYSILAFASRHLYLMTGQEDPNCETYYSQALRILIPILDEPLETLDENVLVGIILLRLFEELSDADKGTHLLGSSRLLNTVSHFASQGGLGEAASWIVLRQDIYVSLTRWQPLRISLDCYKRSNCFRDTGDESLANRAIFLCGQVLEYALTADNHLDADQWAELNNEAVQWYESVPWRRVGPYFPDVPAGSESPAFPSVWMTQPAQVLGYQHFYLARLLLTAFDPGLWRPGFEALRLRERIEGTILVNLRMIIGLAISNPKVFTAVFTSHHILHACGGYLREPREHDAVFQLLKDMKKAMGWNTQPLEEKLTKEWSR